MNVAFANHLALLRRKCGISQREAAAALQVSQALLSHYEKGIREPGLDFVVRAADYYGVSTDLLLGHRPDGPKPHYRPPRDPEAVLPSQYAREAEQTIRDSLDALLDLLARDYDPGVFCYASIYLGEVLYELLRHFFRLSPEYDPALFSLSDESFDSGAVVSDITWVRAQYILSIRQFQDVCTGLPMLTQQQFADRYGPEVCDSVQRLFSMVSHRVTQQGLTESLMTTERFEPHVKPAALRSGPNPSPNPEPNQEATL